MKHTKLKDLLEILEVSIIYELFPIISPEQQISHQREEHRILIGRGSSL